MFRPKARKSDQVQMHLLPPRCCFALAALVWPATEASLTFRTALGTVALGLFATAQQPTGTSLENLLSGRETGRSFFCSYVQCTICWQNSCLCFKHVTIKLWTLQQNKTHIYNHIYILYLNIPSQQVAIFSWRALIVPQAGPICCSNAVRTLPLQRWQVGQFDCDPCLQNDQNARQHFSDFRVPL